MKDILLYLNLHPLYLPPFIYTLSLSYTHLKGGSSPSPNASQARVWLVGALPLTCFQAKCLLQNCTPQPWGLTLMFQEVRWRGTAAYQRAGRGGRFTLGRRFSSFSWSVSGFSSLISSGISILLWRTSANRMLKTFSVSLREMVKTRQTGASVSQKFW